jgi:hypothetical protein
MVYQVPPEDIDKYLPPRPRFVKVIGPEAKPAPPPQPITTTETITTETAPKPKTKK